MNKLSNLLLSCSGANKQVLAQCPTDNTKFIGIGATILLTAVLAGFSGGYAIYFTFESVPIAIFFGLFWATIIFNLDRFIVSSIRKTGDRKKELLIALPRIFIALVLAVTISKPLEVKLFSGSIHKQMGSIEDAYNKRCEDDFKASRDALDQKKETLLKAMESKKNEIYGKDPIYLDGENQRKALVKQNEQKQSEMKNNSSIIANNRKLRHVVTSTGKEYDKWEYNSYAQQLIRENTVLREAIAGNNKQIGVFEKSIAERKLDLTSQIQEMEKQNAVQVAGVQQQINDKNAQRLDIIAKCRTDAAADTDILARLRALSQLKEWGNTVWWASIMITLLFILLETAPIIVKLLSQRGPYDEIMERIELEISKEQEKLKTQKIEEIETLKAEIQQRTRLDLDLRIKTETLKAESELQLNEALLKDISEKMSALAFKEADKWYKNQDSKI